MMNLIYPEWCYAELGHVTCPTDPAAAERDESEDHFRHPAFGIRRAVRETDPAGKLPR